MIVEPKRNLLQRAINRATHRFGIKPFPVVFSSSLPDAGSPHVFETIYQTDYWETPESKSGGGSTIAATADYRPQLVHWIKRLGVRSMFDAPCGDLNWMPLVLEQIDVTYIGGDVSPGVVEEAQQRCPDLDIRLFDIRTDDFPAVDLWHCRDTLFHLSFAAIHQVLNNASRSKLRYAAITTHKARWLKNMDIKTGGFRLVDLRRPPFNLPEPITYLRDYGAARFPKAVGIWPIEALRG